jgi:hypothetical protein
MLQGNLVKIFNSTQTFKNVSCLTVWINIKNRLNEMCLRRAPEKCITVAALDRADLHSPVLRFLCQLICRIFDKISGPGVTLMQQAGCIWGKVFRLTKNLRLVDQSWRTVTEKRHLNLDWDGKVILRFVSGFNDLALRRVPFNEVSF